MNKLRSNTPSGNSTATPCNYPLPIPPKTNPRVIMAGDSVTSLGLTGREVYELTGSGAQLRPRGEVSVKATGDGVAIKVFTARVRIDTPEELTAFTHGGILPYVLRQLVKKQ